MEEDVKVTRAGAASCLKRSV